MKSILSRATSFLAPCILISAACLAAETTLAESPVTVSVQLQEKGINIPTDFTGLSFEVKQVMPDGDGRYYFRPDNEPLIALFRTMGIKSLRIGGNTSDRDAGRLPEKQDLDQLFGFSKAAGVKILYCLQLHKGDPKTDAEIVSYAYAHYSPLIDAFSIGQEPSAYPKGPVDNRPASERMGAANEKYTYSAYSEEWKRFAAAITESTPQVQFCGPSVHNNGEWARRFMDDFGKGQHVTLVTEHLYPGGSGNKVPTPEIGRERMLGPDFVNAYQKLYNSFVPEARSLGLPYRLEEVNNYFNGGASDVSNTYAAALWGLDFMYWWAEHGAAGLNFHTGDRVAAGNSLQISKYTAYFTSPGGFHVRPLGYGIKAFALGGGGETLAVQLSNPESLNLTAYGVRNPGGAITLTLINKEFGVKGRGALLAIPAISGYGRIQLIRLTAPNNDIAATEGITLGGGSIDNGASWKGTWNDLTRDSDGGASISVPPSSAVVLRYSAP